MGVDASVPVVLVHGFPLDARMWPPALGSDSGRIVLRLDLPGFGGVPALPGDGSMGAYADWILARLAETGHPRAVFCGLSMGGYLLFEIWRRDPARVAALALCDTRAAADPPEGRAQRNAAIDLVRTGGRRQFLEGFLRRLVAPAVRDDPRVAATLRGMGEAVSDAGLVQGLAAIRDRPDSTADLASIDVPTLVLAGELDEVTPAEGARAMHAAIRGSRLEVIPGAGHIPPLETPGAFVAAFERFLTPP